MLHDTSTPFSTMLSTVLSSALSYAPALHAAPVASRATRVAMSFDQEAFIAESKAMRLKYLEDFLNESADKHAAELEASHGALKSAITEQQGKSDKKHGE